MTEGFHVHGPHDHELEHAAHSPADSFAGRLAAVTAVLATLGAVFSYMGGVSQSAAALYDNDAAVKKTEADVQRTDLQAKATRQSLSELAIDIVPEARRSHYQEQVRRYASEVDDIKNGPSSSMPSQSPWTKAATTRFTNITAGRRPRRCCRSRLRWRPSHCSPNGIGCSTASMAWARPVPR